MSKTKKEPIGQCEETIFTTDFPRCTRDAYVRENGKNVCANHTAAHIRKMQEIHKKGVKTREYN